MIRVPYISLVNLIIQKKAVKELIQSELTPQNITQELQTILPKGAKRKAQLEDYRQVKVLLGEKGASERAGELMVKYLHLR